MGIGFGKKGSPQRHRDTEKEGYGALRAKRIFFLLCVSVPLR